MAEYLEIVAAAVVVFSIFLFHMFLHNTKSILTNWPIVGMLPSLWSNASRIHDFVTRCLTQSGGTFEFRGPWFARMDYLMTCDPDNVHYILTANVGNFPKGSEFKEIFDPLGDGIFNADNDLWKMQRRMIQCSLKRENVSHFVDDSIKEKVANGLIPLLNLAASMEDMEIDLQQVFQQFTFENICSMVLGTDPSFLSDKSLALKYQKAFDKLEEAMLFRNLSPTTFWKLQKWLHVGIEKQLDEAKKTLDIFLYDCISLQIEELKQARKQGEEAAAGRFALLTAFLDQYEEDGEGQRINGDENSRTFLRDVALSLMLAGRDTVSACLTWFFWLIGTHPSVETKIMQEIEESLKAKDGDEKESASWFLSACKLEELVYLQAALCETLRLYPPVPFNRKKPIVADTLPSGHAVKHSDIILSVYSMGRMKSIWGEDCLEFKPERWISEQGRIIHMSSNKFASFNAGPRTCLGKGLSFTQMKMVAASLLWNYQVQIVEGHPIHPCSSVLLHMKHGLKVRVTKRRNNNGKTI